MSQRHMEDEEIVYEIMMVNERDTMEEVDDEKRVIILFLEGKAYTIELSTKR